MKKTHDATPGAARMSKSLRGLGYSLETAIADLVDNSVEANATEIDVDWNHADSEGPQNWVRISDNGDSMDSQRVTEALVYGSPIDEAALAKFEYLDRLSAFGFGLKTASTSQCKKVLVAARQNPDRRDIHLRELDIDHFVKSDRWEIFEYTRKEEVPTTLYEPLLDQPGTVILWQNLDRLLDYVDPHGTSARLSVEKKFENVERHLGMVFHRYISGTTKQRGKKVTIRVNGTPVQAWDPFCRDEEESVPFEQNQLSVPNGEGPGSVPVYLNAVVLPRKEQFSSESAWEHAGNGSGKGWDRAHGFYFYRSDRIIDEGGWKGMNTLDPHYSLARVSIDFDPRADEAFALDIAKGSVKLPSEIRGGLKDYAAVVRTAANKRRRDTPPPPPPPC